MRRPFAEEQLEALESFEPEPYDSGQRKRFLRCQSERLRSLLLTASGAYRVGIGELKETGGQIDAASAIDIGKPLGTVGQRCRAACLLNRRSQ